MAHFAKLGVGNIVERVIVLEKTLLVLVINTINKKMLL